jgi:hypothetical protein
MRGSAPSAALTVAFEGSARIQAGECHSHVCRCSVVVGNEWWRRWMEPKIHGDWSSSRPPARTCSSASDGFVPQACNSATFLLDLT